MSPRPTDVPVLYWFRADLRLQDNPAWTHACGLGRPLVAAVFAPVLWAREAAWGIANVGACRTAWWAATAQALQAELKALDVPLWTGQGDPVAPLLALCEACGADTVVCEAIAAPYEQAQVAALRAAGITVHSVWQSTLFAAQDLPFAVADMPGVFTQFRHAVERAAVPVRAPLPVPTAVRGLGGATPASVALPAPSTDPRSAFPWHVGAADAHANVPVPAHAQGDPLDAPVAGTRGAPAYLRAYLASDRVARYKATRNGLVGMAYSSKWSPYLAVGALSAPELVAGLRAHEAQHGASEGSYWLWFELLWRDYFRWLHLQQGARLYRPMGLRDAPPAEPVPHDTQAFALWTAGRTGCALVDAGMRELAHSGYLSNRMRQVVASFWVHELGGDWRAGAAWFEAQLLDFDVYSNQGNWLYIAGCGTDPRGGRRFQVAKQTAEHDPDGAYRARWGVAA